MELGFTPELKHCSVKGVAAPLLNPLRGEHAWLGLGWSPGSGPTAQGDRPSSHIPVPSYAQQNHTPDPGCLGQILNPGHSWHSSVYNRGWGEEVWKTTAGHREGKLLGAGEEGSWPGGSDSKTKCPAERAFLLGAQVTLL